MAKNLMTIKNVDNLMGEGKYTPTLRVPKMLDELNRKAYSHLEIRFMKHIKCPGYAPLEMTELVNSINNMVDNINLWYHRTAILYERLFMEFGYAVEDLYKEYFGDDQMIVNGMMRPEAILARVQEVIQPIEEKRVAIIHGNAVNDQFTDDEFKLSCIPVKKLFEDLYGFVVAMATAYPTVRIDAKMEKRLNYILEICTDGYVGVWTSLDIDDGQFDEVKKIIYAAYCFLCGVESGGKDPSEFLRRFITGHIFASKAYADDMWKSVTMASFYCMIPMIMDDIMSIALSKVINNHTMEKAISGFNDLNTDECHYATIRGKYDGILDAVIEEISGAKNDKKRE